MEMAAIFVRPLPQEALENAPHQVRTAESQAAEICAGASSVCSSKRRAASSKTATSAATKKPPSSR
jgi:hypothetical protein